MNLLRDGWNGNSDFLEFMTKQEKEKPSCAIYHDSFLFKSPGSSSKLI
jgi:hypothetical protein